jgi:hypothetical protein
MSNSNLMRMPSLGSLSVGGGSLFDAAAVGLFGEDGADGSAPTSGGWLGAGTGAWGAAASTEGALGAAVGAAGGDARAPLLPQGAPGSGGPLRCIDAAHDNASCRVCIAPPEDGEEGAWWAEAAQ